MYDGVTLTYTEEALNMIAKKAMEDSAMSLEGLIDMVDAANASLSSDGMPHVIDTLA